MSLPDYHLDPPEPDWDECRECGAPRNEDCEPDCDLGGDVPCECGARPALGEACEDTCAHSECWECGSLTNAGESHAVSCPWREPEPLCLWEAS